jgi:hypothetical protein
MAPIVSANAKIWLDAHPQFDALVWTGLESNWERKTGKAFSVSSVIQFISKLNHESFLSAREYILKAADSIQTPARVAMRDHFGCAWLLTGKN